MRVGLVVFVVLLPATSASESARTRMQESTASPAADSGARNLKNSVPANPQSISAGQQTFQKYCQFCHGKDAKGEGPMAPKDSHPPNLTDDVWIHGSSDGEIFTVIRNGAGPTSVMKPNRVLKDQDIWNLVNYLRSLGPLSTAR